MGSVSRVRLHPRTGRGEDEEDDLGKERKDKREARSCYVDGTSSTVYMDRRGVLLEKRGGFCRSSRLDRLDLTGPDWLATALTLLA